MNRKKWLSPQEKLLVFLIHRMGRSERRYVAIHLRKYARKNYLLQVYQAIQHSLYRAENWEQVHVSRILEKLKIPFSAHHKVISLLYHSIVNILVQYLMQNSAIPEKYATRIALTSLMDPIYGPCREFEDVPENLVGYNLFSFLSHLYISVWKDQYTTIPLASLNPSPVQSDPHSVSVSLPIQRLLKQYQVYHSAYTLAIQAEWFREFTNFLHRSHPPLRSQLSSFRPVIQIFMEGDTKMHTSASQSHLLSREVEYFRLMREIQTAVILGYPPLLEYVVTAKLGNPLFRQKFDRDLQLFRQFYPNNELYLRYMYHSFILDVVVIPAYLSTWCRIMNQEAWASSILDWLAYWLTPEVSYFLSQGLFYHNMVYHLFRFGIFFPNLFRQHNLFHRFPPFLGKKTLNDAIRQWTWQCEQEKLWEFPYLSLHTRPGKFYELLIRLRLATLLLLTPHTDECHKQVHQILQLWKSLHYQILSVIQFQLYLLLHMYGIQMRNTELLLTLQEITRKHPPQIVPQSPLQICWDIIQSLVSVWLESRSGAKLRQHAIQFFQRLSRELAQSHWLTSLRMFYYCLFPFWLWGISAGIPPILAIDSGQTIPLPACSSSSYTSEIEQEIPELRSWVKFLSSTADTTASHSLHSEQTSPEKYPDRI